MGTPRLHNTTKQHPQVPCRGACTCQLPCWLPTPAKGAATMFEKSKDDHNVCHVCSRTRVSRTETPDAPHVT
jgi:hypothetical protein